MHHSRTIVISFGRFNPPTVGHEALITFIEQTAHRFRADVRVYPSQSQDAKKNPLPFVEKVRFLKMLFPHIQFNDNPRIRTPFDALADVAAAGYTDVIVVVGSDRTDAFTGFQKYIEPRTSPKYRKDTHIPLDSYRVVPVPVVRGGGGVAGMSASKQRAFAVAGDYETFKQGVPGQNDRVARALYTAVRRHMQIKEFAHIRATIDTQTLRLPLTERADHDGEYHVKCKKCGAEWYADSRFGQTCKKCHNKDRAQMTFTGSETVYEATDSKLRDQAKKEENIQLPTDRTIAEAQRGMPLKGHPWHKKSDAELHYIVKDASAAAKAMRGHNAQAENKYLDQANDASSILYYRKNGGKRITEATTPYNRTGDTEVDRLKTRQKQDEIALKQRQANELMAAKLRDVQQKAREQQTKATAPKPASR